MRTIALVMAVATSAACSFSKMTHIQTDPPGARVRVGGEDRGQTPVFTQLGCTTFGSKHVELSKEGYRTLRARLDYKWSGKNLLWSTVLMPAGAVGYALVGKCPKDVYSFKLDQAVAALEGKSTLTVAELASPHEVYVGGQRVVAGQRLVFEPGWQRVEADVNGARVDAGEVRLHPGIDHVLGLGLTEEPRR
jgi:hypothetical protein